MNQYQPAPAGQIEVEIVAASIGDVPWKASDDNPRGECLRLRLSAGRDYGFVFADVPLDWKSMVRAVRQAAGVTGEELVPGEYIGRRVRVVLNHYTGKDGSTRATVTRWLKPAADQPVPAVVSTPATVEPPRAPAAALQRTAAEPKVSRNAVPRLVADDDIPF